MKLWERVLAWTIIVGCVGPAIVIAGYAINTWLEMHGG